MVEDNGYATTDELFSGSYADLSDQPDLFSNAADLTEVPADLRWGRHTQLWRTKSTRWSPTTGT